jgi:hypothetical protein
MEVSIQLRSPAALPLGRDSPGRPIDRGSVGHRAGLNDAKKCILPPTETEPRFLGRPTNLVAIPTGFNADLNSLTTNIQLTAEQIFRQDTGIGDEMRQRFSAQRGYKFVTLCVPETSVYTNMISTICFDE